MVILNGDVALMGLSGLVANGRGYEIVAEYEAQSYQSTQNHERATALQSCTKPALLIASVSRCLIHYGSNKFNPNKMEPIKNDNWIKPKGGLWTSPIDSNWGWKDWCESENFRECSKENSFTLKLHDWAKICVIDSVSDLVYLPCYESYKRYLDFEKIAENYDAI